ncbi:MAG TPA: phage holin family protein [Gaiellaceae bacterium]|nr:phage holin family protein [Gaiellaceae bacterium]
MSGKPKPIERRRERHGKAHVVIRILVTWVLNAIGLMIGAAFVPGVSLSSFWAALVATAVLGALNAFLWPALIRFALPITAWTLGLGALFLNGLFIWLVAWIIESGFVVERVWQGVLLAIWLTVISIVITTVLSIDDDAVVYRSVVKRQMRKTGAVESDVPGVLFLEIDGLGHEVLQRAMRDGNAPNLARWVQEGSHHLIRWETDWSSQTGAAQTGLLLGSNENIPAFRWWDKEQGRAVASSAPKDVLAIEASLSTGKGLLHADGASRSNMYSGDAVHSSLTIATLRQSERHHERRGQGYLAYFTNPFAMVRTIVLMIADMMKEWWNAAEQRRLDVWPRGHRGFVYSLLRGFMVVVQRDLAMSAVIGDIYAGRPVVYATFSGYDEVAHHSGIERPDALAVLRNLDQTFDRIERATHDAPRPYHVVVLSDHGQSQGPTFFQRYGTTLEEIVAHAAEATVVAAEMGDEGMMHLNVTMTAAAQGGGAVGAIAKPFAKSPDEETMDVASAELVAAGADGKELPEVVTLASGNLGLISFPRIPHRVTLEELEERYPRVIPTLCEHEGVAFVLVRSAEHGAVVIGKSGRLYLEAGRVDGDDPLAPFGENAASKAKRTDGFSHVADIMVNSTYWPELEEVAAFEELIGSHGGMGGPQQYPFVLVPNGFALPDHLLVGPGTVHNWMRRWLADVGQDAYDDERAALAR